MSTRHFVHALLPTLTFAAFAAVAASSSSGDIDVVSGDVPKDFKVRVLEQDFVKRVEMIPMRDGVKLNTLIFIPKGAKDAPILMDRTPYNIGIYEPYVAQDQFLRAGYIRVFQDV